jgi:hypothetical protein
MGGQYLCPHTIPVFRTIMYYLEAIAFGRNHSGGDETPVSGKLVIEYFSRALFCCTMQGGADVPPLRQCISHPISPEDNIFQTYCSDK